jgi:hypothetical protein
MVELVDIRDRVAVQPPPNASPPAFPTPPNQEKNTLSELEMNLSTPIEEVMDSPMDLMQPQSGMHQPQMIDARAVSAHPVGPETRAPMTRGAGTSSAKSYPFNLNEDQIQALIAGLAGVAAFSKPVQDRLLTMLPQAMSPEGGLSPIGMAITAFIAAVIFYLVKRSV